MSRRLGYSFWGFLGDGITDTPDGGRSHRSYLVKTIVERGFDVIMLQRDRDTLEGGVSIDIGQTYSEGFPDIDVLFLEWRWLIPGRNDKKHSHKHTPDWFRQLELINHYSILCPIVLWDKDQTFNYTPPEVCQCLSKDRTYIFEPSLFPSNPTRTSALFPFDSSCFKLNPIPPRYRPNLLIYIGNDYERRPDFCRYFAPASKYLDLKVYGKWLNPIESNRISYYGRIPFKQVASEYSQAIATILLAPRRYKQSGQFTQRLFEALCEGCLTLTPVDFEGVREIIIPELIVRNVSDVVDKVQWARDLSKNDYFFLLKCQRKLLNRFSANDIVDRIIEAIEDTLPQYDMTS